MSVLKFPARIPPPRRADGTLLPAALVALLGLLLGLQLALPSPIVLPESGVSRPLRLAPLAPRPVVVDPQITQRPLFAPNRRETVSAAGPGVAAKAAALAGARVVGVVTVRGQARIFLAAPDGRISAVGLGGRYRGWRLVRIDGSQLTVARGAETAILGVGAAAAVPPAPAETEPEEEQQ